MFGKSALLVQLEVSLPLPAFFTHSFNLAYLA
jgi:hypothetical protein